MVADTMNTMGGSRLTSFEITCPEYVWASLVEFADLSCSRRILYGVDREHSTASAGRALLTPQELVHEDMSEETRADVIDLWKTTALDARETACALVDVHVPPWVALQLTRPYAPVTGIVSATQWAGLFRAWGTEADTVEHGELAGKLIEAYYDTSAMRVAKPGEWHLPYATSGFLEVLANSGGMLPDITALRCLLGTYVDGALEHDAAEFVAEFANTWHTPEGMPLDEHIGMVFREHVAIATKKKEYRASNFTGWNQLRTFDPPIEAFDYAAWKAATAAP